MLCGRCQGRPSSLKHRAPRCSACRPLTPGWAAAPRAQVQEADAMLAEQQRAFSAMPSMQALTG